MPLKVLYLDDEPFLCEIFSEEFSGEEIQVSTFTDPKEALDAARLNPPDIIFLDNRLPGTSGDEVAQAMGGLAPKYLITGDNVVNSTYKFTAVLSKPVDGAVIRAVFDSMLKQKSVA